TAGVQLFSRSQVVRRSEPQVGDILLFTHARGLNLVITTLTRSPYYHVGIYAGEGTVVEMRVKRALIRDLRGKAGAHHFVVIPAPDGKGKEALHWARHEVRMGARYDERDIMVMLLDRIFFNLHLNYTPNTEYTCSEFIAVAFDKVGVRLFPDIPLGG